MWPRYDFGPGAVIKVPRPGEVTVVEELGSGSFAPVSCEHQGEPLVLVARAEGKTSIQRGDHVGVGLRGPIHVFAADGERVGD